jgi:hypothetical protein
MAKRVKYSARAARSRPAKPASRPATAAPRPGSAPPVTSEPATPGEPTEFELQAGSRSALTDAERQRAEALEADMLERERAAISDSLRQRARAGMADSLHRRALDHHPADVNAPLKVRAAREYAYVARDVRRIVLTATLMVAILAVLFVLINVLGVITI